MGVAPDAAGQTEGIREFTVRGLLIGVLIGVVFTAANAYFGLRAGLTFSTSIPAAVISMALLRALGGASIQENNIVQTMASAASTLSSIIFVLPGLIIIGWWSGFPFWMSFAVCATGGILGAMYTIPLRRALVTGSDLRYPEGVACAQVLKVGCAQSHGESSESVQSSGAGLKAVFGGALVSAAFYVLVQTRLLTGTLGRYFRFGRTGAASGFSLSLSFALFAIGYLVGPTVGVSMLLGALIGWGWAVPHFLLSHPSGGDVATAAQGAWSHYVRFVGAGAIGLGAIWTLGSLVKPVLKGLAGALESSRVRRLGQGQTLARTEHDIPIGTVALVALAALATVAGLLWHFSVISDLGAHAALLAVGGVIFVAVMGFLVATVSGYMTGLVGSSNDPLSGVDILAVMVLTLLLVIGVKSDLPPSAGRALVAFALFVTGVISSVGAIANNNLHDLKTGQLVDATPSKQQWAVVAGVLVGALVIPPVLDLLNHAYGFLGAPGVNPAHALPAPQAGLISALAQGVIQHNVDWSAILTGAVIGAIVIALDALLGRFVSSARLRPLAVGLGIYLPTSVTLMIVLGALLGGWFNRRAARRPRAEAIQQLGVLLASGLIVGESLLGVVLAATVAFSGQAAPMALVGSGFATPGAWLGAVTFALVVYSLDRWILRLACS